MNTSTLRAFHISQRKRMTLLERRLKSDLIREQANSLINWPAIKSLHMYSANSLLREVDTGWIEAFAYSMWADIDLVVGDTSPTAALPKAQFDIIIVPLVAFDNVSLHRIGFGGGWYDRLLVMQPNATKIGLAYDFQQTALTPETHDVQLDYIITETRVLSRSD